MALAAQQVVNALVARLSGATVAATRVYSAHTWPLDFDAELPAIRVEIEPESVQKAMLSTDIHEHRARVNVRAFVKGTNGIDATLNALVAQILPALFAAPIPYGLEIDGDIEREFPPEGQAAAAAVVVPVRALYFVAASAPETILSA